MTGDDMTDKKKRKARWLRRLGLLVLVRVVGYFVMSFIYRLPDISSRTQSYMIDDGQATSLGGIFVLTSLRICLMRSVMTPG